MTHPFLHAFTPPTKAESDMVNLVRAKGCLLWDDKGNEYLDGPGQFVVLPDRLRTPRDGRRRDRADARTVRVQHL